MQGGRHQPRFAVHAARTPVGKAFGKEGVRFGVGSERRFGVQPHTRGDVQADEFAAFFVLGAFVFEGTESEFAQGELAGEPPSPAEHAFSFCLLVRRHEAGEELHGFVEYLVGNALPHIFVVRAQGAVRHAGEHLHAVLVGSERLLQLAHSLVPGRGGV